MKPAAIKKISYAILIIIPIFMPIAIPLRFGIPIITLAYLAITRRGFFFYLLGMRAAGNRDHEKTLKHMTRAARAGLPVHRGCIAAVTLLKLKKPEIAAELFTSLDKKVKSDPDRNHLNSYKALLHWYNGNRENAEDMLRDLFEAGYRTTHLYSTLGYFILHNDSSDIADQIAYTLEAIEYDDTADIRDNLTALYIKAADWESAAENSSIVLEKKPKFAEAWYHAGVIEEHMENMETALDHYRKAQRSIFSTLSVLDKEDVEKCIARLAAIVENETLNQLPDTSLPVEEEE